MRTDATKRTPRLDDRVLELLDFVYDTPIGWIVSDGEVFPPFSSHGEHKYDGGCAVCRCGDDSRALEAFLSALAGFGLSEQENRK